MRVKRLMNVSEHNVFVNHTDGRKTWLPPGGELSNEDITNIDEIRDRVSVTYDLGEVNESAGKHRLDD